MVARLALTFLFARLWNVYAETRAERLADVTEKVDEAVMVPESAPIVPQRLAAGAETVYVSTGGASTYGEPVLAERAGFEPADGAKPHQRLSKPPHSTTLPPLRGRGPWREDVTPPADPCQAGPFDLPRGPLAGA